MCNARARYPSPTPQTSIQVVLDGLHASRVEKEGWVAEVLATSQGAAVLLTLEAATLEPLAATESIIQTMASTPRLGAMAAPTRAVAVVALAKATTVRTRAGAVLVGQA